MTQPSFVAEYETVWDSTTSPKTVMNAVAITAGDVLVACIMAEGNDGLGASLGITENGSSSWVEKQRIAVNAYCELVIYTYTAVSNENLTVTITCSSGIVAFGCNILHFNASGGVGTGSNKENGTDGGAGTEPSLSITTEAADSAVVIACGDWTADDGGDRAWRNNVGSAVVEKTFAFVDTRYTAYAGYHATCGAANTYAVGLSAPVSMKYSIAAVEVKGIASVPIPVFQASYRRRRIS